MAEKEEKRGLGLAAAIMGEVAAATPKATEAAEKPKRRTRKSIIDSELLPGPTGEQLKKKRQRARKDPELRKSHNMTILMTEQTYQRFRRIAEKEGLSMNGIINRLIKKYIIAHDIDDEYLDI